MKCQHLCCVQIGLILLLGATVCKADSMTRVPTGDDGATGTWTVYPDATDRWADVDDAVASPDEDATYIYCTAVGNATFTFSAFSVPAGATITNVNVFFRHKKTTGAPGAIGAVIKVGGNYYTGTEVNPTKGVWNTSNSIALNNTQWTTNPKTGIAWTVDDVNGVGANALQALGVHTTDVAPNPYCTQVYIEVNYTPLTLSISVAPTSWPVGIVDNGTAQISTSEDKVSVTNDGSNEETFSLQIFDEDDRGEWTASSSEDGAANNVYVFSGIFCATTDAPTATSFNEGASDDVITTTTQPATTTKFAYTGGTADGTSVPVDATRFLWFRLDTPTAVSGTYAYDQHTIIVRISCQLP